MSRPRTMGRHRAWRAGFAGLAALAVVWAATAGRGRLRTAGVGDIASDIWNGRAFAPEAIARTKARLGPAAACGRAEEARAATGLALATALDALDDPADEPSVKAALTAAEQAAVAALACAPRLGEVWLALFWARVQRDGWPAANFELLRASYQLAPHEAPVQSFRLPQLIGHWGDLPADVQALALADLRDLVSAGYDQRAAGVYAEAPDALRPTLLAQADGLPAAARQQWANAIWRLGLEADLDGVADGERQNWRKYLDAVDHQRALLRTLEPPRSPPPGVPPSACRPDDAGPAC